MIGRLRPFTVQRQEITILAKAKDSFDEQETQSKDEINFCNNVDHLIETLNNMAILERLPWGEIDYLNNLIEHAEIELYGLQNN